MKFTKDQYQTAALAAVFTAVVGALVAAANEGYKRYVKPRFAAKPPASTDGK